MRIADRSDGTAARILEAADRLFYAQGYDNTGVNQLIAEAAVAKASFYHHFPSKRKLGAAYLRKRHEIWFARLRDATKAFPRPRGRIDALFDFLSAWLVETGYRGCAFINVLSESAGSDDEMRSLSVCFKAEFRKEIETMLVPLGVDRARACADTVYLLFEGATVTAQVSRSLWPVDAARRTAADLLARR